jgi:hypothetical protein
MSDAESAAWLAADWMLTASGQQFRPTAPDPALVRVTDIAHALSHLCRYNGHVRSFYSVAEHSVLMARHFIARRDYPLARWALLHDGSEAYLGDVIRPLKKALPDYKADRGQGRGGDRAGVRPRGRHAARDQGRRHADPARRAARAVPGRDRREARLARPRRARRRDRLWSPERARREFLDTHDFLFGPVLA